MLLTGVGVLAVSELLSGPGRSVLARAANAVPVDSLVVPVFFLVGLLFLPSWTYRSIGFGLAFPVAVLVAALGRWILRPRRALVLVDAFAVPLIVGWVWDVFFWGGLQVENWNYYLGPVNEVLHGRTLLVDIVAQYGIGVMYFLGGLFSLIPIGYGTFALVLWR